MAKEEVSPLALMEMRIEDDGVFRLPKVDGLPEDEDDALEYARIAWSQLDLAFYAACRGFAHYATAIRVRMGYLLATVQERFGPATYTTFREQIGIEKRTANNYKKLYEKRNHEFIMKLPPTKALRLIGALDKEGVELGDDKVKINIAGEWKEVGLEQATECTVSDFVALLDAHREGQK